MELTISEITALEAEKKNVRAITVDQLRKSEGDISMVLPYDVYTTFMETISDQLGHLPISEPQILASHLTVTSVNGEMLYRKPNGTDNRQDVFKGRDQDEKITLGIKYNRVQIRVKVGIEQELTNTLLMNYTLDRPKCQFAHGKIIAVADTLSLMREQDVFRSTPKDIGESVRGLEAHLAEFEAHSQAQDLLLHELQVSHFDNGTVNAILADHHYRAAQIAHGQRRGVRQIVDDNTLKTAHWLMYHSRYPYRIETWQPNITAFDLYCCFIEALQIHNKDLVLSFDKHLRLFDYLLEVSRKLGHA
jgi:hypothetical protein